MPRKPRIDLAGYHHVKLLEEELENLEKIKNQKSIKKENVTRLANERITQTVANSNLNLITKTIL